MKTNKFLAMALVAAMAAGCSNDDMPEVITPDTPQAQGNSYISLAINLPTTSASTRGDDDNKNDNFDDGLSSEYEVKDATLILFQQASGENKTEYDATFCGAYSLPVTAWTMSGTTTDNITSTAQITQKINSVSSNLYALVVLNANSILSVGENAGLSVPSSISTTGDSSNKTETWSTSDTSAKTFKDFCSLTANIASKQTSGFFMCNAPLASAVGADSWNGTISTMPEIESSKIYQTEDEAAKNPAAEIYVERAVAKVQVTSSLDTNATLQGSSSDSETEEAADDDGGTSTSTAANTLKVEFYGWTLDNTHNTSYLVRDVNFVDNSKPWSYQASENKGYRFIGTTAVASSLYRTYWGMDPNYSKDNSTENSFMTAVNTSGDDFSWSKSGDVAYCNERTFAVDQMKVKNTTRVIISMKLNGGSDFYMLESNKSVVYTDDQIKNVILNAYLNNSTINAYYQGKLADGKSCSAEDFQVTINKSEAGEIISTDVTISITGNNENFTSGTTAYSDAEGSTVFQDLINNLNIMLYKDGIAYYPVLIKHFGDTYTPWEQDKITDNVPYSGDNAAQNYLGRYGVLRNNWYELEVNTVKSIGSATVPSIEKDGNGDEWDDNIENYIAVKINIFSWAKRKQSVEL